MKPGLQVRLHQQLTLTPQLQQAIRLLQMSTLELGAELRELAEANPLLDMESLDAAPPSAEAASDDASDLDTAGDDAESFATDPGDTPLQFEGFADRGGQSGARPGDPWQTLEACAEQSLYEHLIWQLDVSSVTERQHAVMAALIDALDDDGYLRIANEEIRAAFAPGKQPDDPEIEAARRRLATFDPTGVGSRALDECLAAQLGQLDPDDACVALARRIVTGHLDLLARNDVDQLARQLDAEPADLLDAIALIHGLDPKPGHSFDTTPVEYITPDAYASKHNGVWRVTLNPDCRPRLEINQHYFDLIGKTSRDDTSYLRGQLQEARWLLKSLESRADTILKVATAIVDAQSAFLDFGPQAMRPLVLREVAETIDMHESTVSRVTTRKYLHTPRGIFEFKYFFSSGVGTEDGGSASATAVQALIRRLVDGEDRRKPLSDQALVEALGKEGIQVARRTVAKYRRLLRISNSSQRVQLHD